jgi:hypothetical protein
VGSASVPDVTGPGIEEIGIAIFADWVLPFEVLSMLLLAALIGAIVLSRRETGESGEESVPTRIEFGDDRARRATGGDFPNSATVRWRADAASGARRGWPMSPLGPLLLATFLFCVGIYGVIARRNAVLVLMSVELMLNAVNINLVAFQNLLFPG